MPDDCAFPEDFQLDIVPGETNFEPGSQPLQALLGSEARPRNVIDGSALGNGLYTPSYLAGNIPDEEKILGSLNPTASIESHGTHAEELRRILGDAGETMYDSGCFPHEYRIPPGHENTILSSRLQDLHSQSKQDSYQNGGTASTEGWHTISTNPAASRSGGISRNETSKERLLSPEYENWMKFQFSPSNATLAVSAPPPDSQALPPGFDHLFQYNGSESSRVMPLIIPTIASWPSTMTTLEKHPSAPPVASTNTPTATRGPRRTLTNEERRQLCLFHETNPSVKQTEIGGEQ